MTANRRVHLVYDEQETIVHNYHYAGWLWAFVEGPPIDSWIEVVW